MYALEGSIAITGALVQWMRDNLKMIQKSSDIEELAKTVDDAGGIYFIAAPSPVFTLPIGRAMPAAPSSV